MLNAILEPVESHVYCFASFLFYGVAEDAFDSANASAEWGAIAGLGVAELDAGCVEGDKFVGTVVGCGDFRLSSRANDHFEDGGNGDEESIHNLRVGVAVAQVDIFTGLSIYNLHVFVAVAQVDIFAGLTTCFESEKVGSVTVAAEDHVTCVVDDASVGVGGAVIEEVCNRFDSVGSTHGDLGCKIVDCMDDGRVDGAGIID